MLEWAAWNGVGFVGALFVGSVIEWAAHRFILHSDKIVKFAYRLHDTWHHNYFKADETYTASLTDSADKWRLDHILFVPRDYLLFILVTAPLWLGAEFVLGVPIAFGGSLATLTGLQMFNSLHFRFHCPSDTWFQRTRYFNFLKEHHRLHHEDQTKNFNVHFLPIADILLGTFRK
ncbi:MAG: sterol desaturase family protein [Nitrospiria bacterium]